MRGKSGWAPWWPEIRTQKRGTKGSVDPLSAEDGVLVRWPGFGVRPTRIMPGYRRYHCVCAGQRDSSCLD